jgi:hypothetical protein
MLYNESQVRERRAPGISWESSKGQMQKQEERSISDDAQLPNGLMAFEIKSEQRRLKGVQSKDVLGTQ